MKKLIERINRVSVSELEAESADKLILKSKPRKILNPLFVIGAVGFVVSSLIRGFLYQTMGGHIGELLLGISVIILIAGVWHLSGAGKFIINKTEGKVFRVYRHLGYLQKVYSYPIASIESVKIENSNGQSIIYLVKDDTQKIWVLHEKNDAKDFLDKISDFLAK